MGVNISGKKLSDLGGQVVDADTGAIVYQLRENGAWTPPVRENTQAPETETAPEQAPQGNPFFPNTRVRKLTIVQL